jgi:hypothetical protein
MAKRRFWGQKTLWGARYIGIPEELEGHPNG